MKPRAFHAADLTDAQVISLLSMGLKRPREHEAGRALLRAALEDPSGQKLELLLEDFQSLVIAPHAGPLSFQRCMQAGRDLEEELAGQSFLTVLTSQQTSQEALDALARFGAMLATDPFPPATRLTGFVIRLLAASMLFARFAVTLDGFDLQLAAEALESLGAVRELPETIRGHAIDTATDLKPP